MRDTLFSLAAVMTSTLVLLMGSGLLGTTLSLQMGVQGLAAPLIGFIMAGFYVGMILGGLFCYWVIARTGHIRAFAVFAAAGTASVMLRGLIFDPWVWFALRILNGMALLGLYVVIESWLNDRAKGPARGRVFSIYMVVSFLGLGVGQFLLNLGSVEDQSLYLIAGMLFALSLLPLALTRTVHPPPPTGASSNFRRLFRIAPFGVMGSFVAGAAMGSFFALGAVYAVQVGLDVAGVSLLMGVTVLAGLFLQWPIGHLSDFYDRLKVLCSLKLAMAAIALLISLFGDLGLLWLLPLAAVFGGIGATLYPVAVAHVNDHVDAAELVSTSASLIKAYGVGAVLGPLGASLLIAVVGPAGLFLFTALVCAVAAGVMLLTGLPVVRRAVEEQLPFISLPRSGSPLITELDPRLWDEDLRGATTAAGTKEAESGNGDTNTPFRT